MKGKPKSIASIPGLREIHRGSFSGVYFLCSKKQVVYVGQSMNVPSRVQEHKEKQYDQVFFLPVPSAELDAVEKKFIALFRPKLNQILYQPATRPPAQGSCAQMPEQLRVDPKLAKAVRSISRNNHRPTGLQILQWIIAGVKKDRPRSGKRAA